MLGLLKGLVVLGFVILGVLAGRDDPNSSRRRRRINWFIGYTLAVTAAVGAFQSEAWPFSAWPLVATTVPSVLTHPRFVAIDRHGEEHEIDHRAWAPLVFQELIAWEEGSFLRLSREDQDRAAAYLLGIVEQARVRWRAGEPETHFDRYLGKLSAPFFLGHPDRWIPGERVPAESFIGLRLYHESWNVRERRLEPAKVTRRIVYEYRQP